MLGEELMSTVSSVAIKLTEGHCQLVSTDAYRSHSESPWKGGRHRTRDLLFCDGVKSLKVSIKS